jgi:hypothetical protein
VNISQITSKGILSSDSAIDLFYSLIHVCNDNYKTLMSGVKENLQIKFYRSLLWVHVCSKPRISSVVGCFHFLQLVGSSFLKMQIVVLEDVVHSCLQHGVEPMRRISMQPDAQVSVDQLYRAHPLGFQMILAFGRVILLLTLYSSLVFKVN